MELTRREETKVVKEALIKAGFSNVRVGHGVGTAWGWLHIYCDAKSGQTWRGGETEATQIAQAVTGRHGDYDGNINVYVEPVN